MGELKDLHRQTNRKRILQRQKRIIAPDFPFYVVSLWKCSCNCGGYYVTIDKEDLGYRKNIKDIEYNNSLEAYVHFEKLVEDCTNGKFDMQQPGEGETFE